MGYFALNLKEDTKENLLTNIRSNLELYEKTEKGHSYLLDCFVQSDLNKLIELAKEKEKEVNEQE